MGCNHPNFQCSVNVGRICDNPDDPNEMPKAYTADIKIECAECREPFIFIGSPMGVSWDGPTTSINGQELRVPLRPANDFAEREVLPGFSVTVRKGDQ